MAIANSRIQIAGVWHNLTFNSTNQRWEATVSAPTITSWHQPNNRYACVVEATNTAGVTASATTADPVVGNDLRLRVMERIPPVITITSPANGACGVDPHKHIEFQVVDELNGSGVDLWTVTCNVDGVDYTVDDFNLYIAPIANGFEFGFMPSEPWADGLHTVIVNARDNDGNIAVEKSISFVVGGTFPALDIFTPLDGEILHTPNINVIGITADDFGEPMVVTIELNSVDQGHVEVELNGEFSHSITLAEGANTIVVTATTTTGITSTLTLNVTLETKIPEFKSVSLQPNPVDAGATLIVSVEVE